MALARRALTGDVLSMNAPNGIGTSADPILTAATSDTATATTGAVYITQTGAGSRQCDRRGRHHRGGYLGNLDRRRHHDRHDRHRRRHLGQRRFPGARRQCQCRQRPHHHQCRHRWPRRRRHCQLQPGRLQPDHRQHRRSFVRLCPPMPRSSPSTRRSAGLGDAIIGMGSIGTNAGGEITVNSNGGNILWSNDPVYAAFTDVANRPGQRRQQHPDAQSQ